MKRKTSSSKQPLLLHFNQKKDAFFKAMLAFRGAPYQFFLSICLRQLLLVPCPQPAKTLSYSVVAKADGQLFPRESMC